MDTNEIMRLGADALITKLCNDIAEIARAVPDAGRVAVTRLRTALGHKVFSSGTHVNGTKAAKLASELVVARAQRTTRPSTKKRPPMTVAQRAQLSKSAKARWAAARKAGLATATLPTTSAVSKAAKV